MKPIKYSLLLWSFLLFTACASHPELHDLETKVSGGMDKDEVLDVMGNPQLTKRRQSQDIWQYYFYEGDNRTIKEVHFKDGKVIYKGDPAAPKSNQTAKAIDERNSRANAAQSSESAFVDTEPMKEKTKRMQKDLESEIPAQKSNYQELE